MLFSFILFSIYVLLTTIIEDCFEMPNTLINTVPSANPKGCDMNKKQQMAPSQDINVLIKKYAYTSFTSSRLSFH